MRKHFSFFGKSLSALCVVLCWSWVACSLGPTTEPNDAGPVDIVQKAEPLAEPIVEPPIDEAPSGRETLPENATGRCEQPMDCAQLICDQKSCGSGCICQNGVAVETQCTDGQDNDQDGAKDCADTDCDGKVCGDGCICEKKAKKELLCTDGIDNDGDGKVDCADSDCEGQSCGDHCLCAKGQKQEQNCSDGLDNDGDGKVDCQDPDCLGKSCGKDCVCHDGKGYNCSKEKLDSIITTRIEPLIKKGAPSTCNQCHLSGVDLSIFVQDTPCRSMGCMKERGMVDFADPANSKILKDILRADPKSTLITKQIQDQEYQGFLAWITFSSVCQETACGPTPNACGKGGDPPPPAKTLPMLGGCDETSLVTSFRALVAPERGRCIHCHGANSGHPQAPGYFDANDDLEGDRRTMYNIIGLKAVDVNDPTKSRILTKPLAESEGGIPHGGGDKVQNKDEPTYKNILQWIQQYAACVAPKPKP